MDWGRILLQTLYVSVGYIFLQSWIIRLLFSMVWKHDPEKNIMICEFNWLGLFVFFINHIFPTIIIFFIVMAIHFVK